MAGGVNSPTYASMQNWAVAAITLVVVIGLSQFAKDMQNWRQYFWEL